MYWSLTTEFHRILIPTKHSLRPYDLDDRVSVQNQLKCLNSIYFMISVNPANARFTEMFEQCLIPHLAFNLLYLISNSNSTWKYYFKIDFDAVAPLLTSALLLISIPHISDLISISRSPSCCSFHTQPLWWSGDGDADTDAVLTPQSLSLIFYAPEEISDLISFPTSDRLISPNFQPSP